MSSSGSASRRLAVALAAAAALVAAGCGIGAGGSASDVHLLVTQDFGAAPVSDLPGLSTQGEDTVMRLLERHARVRTKYGGGFVESIDGVAGGQRHGRPVDWFYYINGTQAGKGAAATKVRDGDAIWWDRHDWGLNAESPAVVGQFPAPFSHGLGGRKLPTRLECVPDGVAGCDEAASKLSDAGIVFGRGGIQGSLTKKTLRVIVGRWSGVRLDEAAQLLEEGPRTSGVFARIDPDGRRIQALDPAGRVAGTYGPGTGLVAAVRLEGAQPVWIVTGTDDAGIRAAASALDDGNLKGKFALLVADGRALALPVVRPGR